MELKRARATQEAVHQLSRYVDAVQTFLQGEPPIREILAAPGLSAPAAMTLERLGLEYKEINTPPAAKQAAAQPLLF